MFPQFVMNVWYPQCFQALVVPHGYSWAFTVRPNDIREDRLPRDITEGVHWLVSTR